MRRTIWDSAALPCKDRSRPVVDATSRKNGYPARHMPQWSGRRLSSPLSRSRRSPSSRSGPSVSGTSTHTCINTVMVLPRALCEPMPAT